jgi:guanylate kinase
MKRKINRFSAPSDLENNDSQTFIKQRRFEFRISISAASRESRGEEANGKIITMSLKNLKHIKNEDFVEGRSLSETISTEL